MEVITLIQGDADSHLSPLFLVHAISGVALPYLRLHPLSDTDRPIYGITNPIHCAGADKFKYPSSLAELAAIYLDGIARIQPHGPYLIGGWSMGGMIAMFMAQILQARGEAVAKVIMIDSANPEVFPCFSSAQEHREFANATYDKTIALGAAEFGAAVMSPVPSPVISDGAGFDEFCLSRQRRASTWRTVDWDGSSVSSLFESPMLTPSSPRSPDLCSDLSDYEDDDDDDDACGLGLDVGVSQQVVDDESPALKQFLAQIKLHIHRGLQLIADVRPGDLFTPGKRSNYDVVLIKCRPDGELLQPVHRGVAFIMSVMRESSMRWDPRQFRSFEVKRFSSDHNGAFAPEHVGELSAILRECLAGED